MLNFEYIPDEYILNKICQEILNFNSYNDKYTIILHKDLLLNNTHNKFIIILPDINEYISDSTKITEIKNLRKCISITRQFLNHAGYDLFRFYKMINGTNYTAYKITIKNYKNIKETQYKPKIISFD